MHNSGTNAFDFYNFVVAYGKSHVAQYLDDLSKLTVIRHEESLMSKLEKRLKVIEKEMIKFPRRIDLKLEAIQLRKDIKAINIKEKK